MRVNTEQRATNIKLENKMDFIKDANLAIQGDEKAMERLYYNTYPKLKAVTVSILKNESDAEDIIQETYIKTFSSLNQLDNASKFEAWLCRIASNKCKDYLKKQRFTEELTDNLNVFYDMPSEEIGIMDCICKLNPKSSIYITLRFYNDMTYEDVAQVLKEPVSTTKYKTQKALLELKKYLKGDVS